jgi:hypothetical protein
MAVICLALLIFCSSTQRQAITPAVKLDGLYPGQKAKPTGRLIFQTFAGLRLIPATSGQPATIPQPGAADAVTHPP